MDTKQFAGAEIVRLLKTTTTIIPLTQIINAVLRIRYYPQLWKVAHII